MAKVKILDDNFVQIKCPAGHYHTLCVKKTDRTEPNRPCWGFNWDVNKPTFTPSILEKTGRYVIPSFDEEGIKGLSWICHSFVTNGMIKFLGDCTHELKNQTVELLDIE